MALPGTDKLRVVQVGCGPRALVHMNAMRASGAVELLAACDLDESRLTAARERFALERCYADLSEMIRREEPDLVDIVTPPTVRTSICQAAIEAGAHNLLVEKPVALRPSEVRAMAGLGRQALIAVNTQYQWMPHWQRFWELLEQRELGAIRWIRISSRANVLEQGPHLLNLALKAAHISGLDPPQWVLAGASGVDRFGKTPVPLDLTATVGLGDARLYMNHGPSAPPSPDETVFWYHMIVEIVGTQGRLYVTLNRGWELWRSGHFETGETGWPKDDTLAQIALFQSLRDTIHNGTQDQFATRMEVAARETELLLATYASAINHQRVPLPAELSDDIIEKVEHLENP